MNWTLKSGLITMLVGGLVMFSPLFIAWIETAPGANMWNESDPNSGGSALWLFILTLPTGLLIGLVGLILAIVGAVKSSKK